MSGVSISELQFREFNSEIEARFIGRLVTFLRQEFDVSLCSMSDASLQETVQAAVQEARFSGLTTEQDVALYAFAKAALGENFPDRMEGLFERLTDLELHYSDRSALLAKVIEGQG